MSYQPDDTVTMQALKARTRNRDNQYVSLIETTWKGLVKAASQFGVPTDGRLPHVIACDIVDKMYPDVLVSQADMVAQNPDTVYAQTATAYDQHRFRDVLGHDDAGVAWPVDVPERQAGVGYKRADGTVVPLDSEGSVLLSGWGPEQVRFLLVSVAQFFDGDYIKEFVLGLDLAARRGDLNLMTDMVGAFIAEQNWSEDAEQSDLSENPEPISEDPEVTGYWRPAEEVAEQGLPAWNEATHTEYPTVGTGNSDAPTEVISTGEINQYKPGPY